MDIERSYAKQHGWDTDCGKDYQWLPIGQIDVPLMHDGPSVEKCGISCTDNIKCRYFYYREEICALFGATMTPQTQYCLKKGIFSVPHIS